MGRPLDIDLADEQFGRSETVLQVIHAVEQQHSLVSITGPGGIGKTAIARAVASRVADQFSDGVVWLDLHEFTDTNAALRHFARELGDTSAKRLLPDRIADVLADQHILVVLDTLEHLIELRQLIGTVRPRCPNLSILITSRRRLNLGDQKFEIGPLDRQSAVAMFRSRAAQYGVLFGYSDHAARLLSDLCSNLDDLPLAIELAAAQSVAFELEVLAGLVRDYPLTVLTNGGLDRPLRLQSAEGSITWSYDLLDDSSRLLLRHFGVLADVTTFDAISRLTPFDRGTLSRLLNKLIEHNLIVFRDDGYIITRLMRHFCVRELEAHGELSAAYDRQSRYYLSLTRVGVAFSANGLRKSNDRYIRELMGELMNIRASSLHLLGSGDAGAALELVTNLRFFWWKANQPFLGILAIERVMMNQPEAPTVLTALAWFIHGFLNAMLGDGTAAVASNKRANLQISMLDYVPPRASAEMSLLCELTEAYIAAADEAYHREGNRLRDALDALGELGAVPESPFLAAMRRRVAIRLVSADLLLAAKDTSRIGATTNSATQHLLSALNAIAEHAPATVAQASREAFAVAADQDDRPNMYQAITSAAVAASQAGFWRDAARLFGAADAIEAEVVPLTRRHLPDAAALRLTRWDRMALRELKRAGFHHEWSTGYRNFSVNGVANALDLLLQQLDDIESKPAEFNDPLALTPRPLEVARLIAKGRSNRQIANELFIDADTVKSHRRVVRAAVRRWLAIDPSAELDDRRLTDTLRQIYGNGS